MPGGNFDPVHGFEQVVLPPHALMTELGQDLNQIEQRSRAELAEGYHRTDPRPNATAGEEG